MIEVISLLGPSQNQSLSFSLALQLVQQRLLLWLNKMNNHKEEEELEIFLVENQEEQKNTQLKEEDIKTQKEK
jgi:hypothetical protein